MLSRVLETALSLFWKTNSVEKGLIMWCQSSDCREEGGGGGARGLRVQSGAFQAKGTSREKGAEAADTRGCFNPHLVGNSVFQTKPRDSRGAGCKDVHTQSQWPVCHPSLLPNTRHQRFDHEPGDPLL